MPAELDLGVLAGNDEEAGQGLPALYKAIEAANRGDDQG